MAVVSQLLFFVRTVDARFQKLGTSTRFEKPLPFSHQQLLLSPRLSHQPSTTFTHTTTSSVILACRRPWPQPALGPAAVARFALPFSSRSDLT